MAIELRLKALRPGVTLPAQAYDGDAGLDLCAAEGLVLPPGGRGLVPCGIAIAVPEGHAGLVLPRSGLAARHGIWLVNSPGLIDPAYRGEVSVILANQDPAETFTVEPGMRIAQLLLVPATAVKVIEVDDLEDTQRGERGFGSSGV